MNESDSRNKLFAVALLKYIALLVVGYILGSFNDAPVIGMLIVSAATVAWHLFNLAKFRDWLNHKELGPIPYGSGSWPTIFARAQHIRTRATTHKNRSSELEQANMQLVESLPNAAYLLDENDLIVSINDAGRELAGNLDEFENQPVSNFLRQPELSRYLKNEDDSEMVTITSPRNPEQTYQCVISEFSDQRRLLQLIDVSAQVKAMQIREDFVGNASHELRTPVTVIKGYLDAFEDDQSLPADLKTPIKAMNDQVDRMQAIISDLLALNVLESSGPATTDNVVDFPALIKDAHTQALKSKLCPANLNITIDSVQGIRGSESALQSIITNLISNAMRFTPKDGTIEVRWKPASPGTKLVVKDNGIGIDHADLQRITERFYRTDTGRARHQFGTGLGLAIVKHALARHDAKLIVTSEVGKGSTFTCHFPLERIANTTED